MENIEGVDSVTAWFDASEKNEVIYGDNKYGIDDYGDILLERYVKNAFGNKVPVRDIYPLIRGGWDNEQGVHYEDSLKKDKISTLNINLRGYTPDDYNSRKNKSLVTQK